MDKHIDRFPAGVLDIPPSKSAAHRALICAALAGRGTVGTKSPAALAASVGLSFETASDDIRATAEGICRVLSAWERGGEVFCGESGSTLRFLIPVAAMTGGEWIFKGCGRLLQRPMGIYEKLFHAHGAIFEHEKTAPAGDRIRVKGPLPVGDYILPGDISSQFVTGLLLALPLASGAASGTCLPGSRLPVAASRLLTTTPLESRDYVALTLGVMCAFGVQATACVGETGTFDGYFIQTAQRYKAPPEGFHVEGDWSQAAFFLCAGALGAEVSLRGLDPESLQGDRLVTEVLMRMGARIEWENGLVRALPPLSGTLCGTEIDAQDIPDIVPPLAALACFSAGETRFTGAGRLRIKESDRLAALARELPKFGTDVRETADGLVIQGRAARRTEVCAKAAPEVILADAHGDHRIAMAVAVAALASIHPVRLRGAECVAKSYPDFWEDFGKEVCK